jgi:DNA-binding transcriptional LysR family regulator
VQRKRTSLLAGGRFLTLLPESMVRHAAKYMPIAVLPVDLPTSLRPVTIVTMKGRTLSSAGKLFVTSIREEIRPLTSGR